MTSLKTMPLSHPAKCIGTWFGVGLSPIAPGTMGSIAALPFAYVIQVNYGNAALFWAAVMAFVVGCVACQRYLPFVESRDPREMVIDEVHGQWLLLSVMPPTFVSYAVGLFLFRFFDILKPWPIRVADRNIHGGFGVMFDDTLAALYPMALVGAASVIGAHTGHPHVLETVRHFLSRTYVFR